LIDLYRVVVRFENGEQEKVVRGDFLRENTHWSNEMPKNGFFLNDG
jgi:hypothetical protein